MPRYITRQGHDAINAELDRLWRVERPYMVNQVADAAALGDRSENAEYIYGKKRLAQIDSRMRYLQRKIDDVVVVDLETMPQHRDVRFGAVVTVEDDDGDQHTWRLVDKVESDPGRNRISVQSPVGMALLGKRVGDMFEIDLPKGLVGYEIIAIRYGGADP